MFTNRYPIESKELINDYFMSFISHVEPNAVPDNSVTGKSLKFEDWIVQFLAGLLRKYQFFYAKNEPLLLKLEYPLLRKELAALFWSSPFSEVKNLSASPYSQYCFELSKNPALLKLFVAEFFKDLYRARDQIFYENVYKNFTDAVLAHQHFRGLPQKVNNEEEKMLLLFDFSEMIFKYLPNKPLNLSKNNSSHAKLVPSTFCLFKKPLVAKPTPNNSVSSIKKEP